MAAILVRMPDDLHAAVLAAAIREDRSAASLIRRAIEAHLAGPDDTQPREAQPAASARRVSPRAARSASARGTQPPGPLHRSDVTPIPKKGSK